MLKIEEFGLRGMWPCAAGHVIPHVLKVHAVFIFVSQWFINIVQEILLFIVYYMTSQKFDVYWMMLSAVPTLVLINKMKNLWKWPLPNLWYHSDIFSRDLKNQERKKFSTLNNSGPRIITATPKYEGVH
jgi:hypothetical protein